MGPAWPHTHTLSGLTDDVYIRVSGELHQLTGVTISGALYWQRVLNGWDYYVMERVPGGEAFAGVLLTVGQQEGQMNCLVLSPHTRQVSIEFVQLGEQHLRAIRQLKLGPLPPEVAST